MTRVRACSARARAPRAAQPYGRNEGTSSTRARECEDWREWPRDKSRDKPGQLAGAVSRGNAHSHSHSHARSCVRASAGAPPCSRLGSGRAPQGPRGSVCCRTGPECEGWRRQFPSEASLRRAWPRHQSLADRAPRASRRAGASGPVRACREARSHCRRAGGFRAPSSRASHLGVIAGLRTAPRSAAAFPCCSPWRR